MSAATGVRASIYKKSDLGNAQRLAARYAETVRHVSTTGCWHIWRDGRWAIDDTGEIERYARTTVRAMQREAHDMAQDTEEQIKAHTAATKWAVASENSARLAAMVGLCRAEPGIAARFDDFDARALELNAPNGIVDLRTGKLHNHDPAAMHSQSTAAEYRPGAPAPAWTEFVERVLPEPAVRNYVQRLLGVSLVGATMPGHEFPFLFGEGGTGKSTLLETVAGVLGDYAAIAPTSLLAVKRGAGQSYDVAGLRGKRLVVVEEVSGAMDEDAIKRITASAHLEARQIYQAALTFVNVTSLWMASNHEPRIDGTDSGLRRRIKQVPMDVKVDGAFIGPMRAQVAASEQEGVLAWLVAGCVAAHKGLRPPKAVDAATQAMFDDANPLLAWLAACTAADAAGRASARDLHDSYVDWCRVTRRRNQYQAVSRSWTRALLSVGLERVRAGNGWAYAGRRLLQPAV